ncbi:MAG: hypothetical protein WA709_18410 [Stellaceae bacterium]
MPRLEDEHDLQHDQVTTDSPASRPPLETTYDQAAHSRLPGVDVRGAEVHRPYGQPH